jgi:hypothetical protein
MYLPWAQEENRVILDSMRYEIYIMLATSSLQNNNQEEIMPVQFLHHILAIKQLLNVAYAKTS